MSELHISQTREIPRRLAREKKPPIPYSAIAEQIGVAARSMGGLLRPILYECAASGRALLPVLVVQLKTGLPSPEFFEQGRDRRVMAPNLLPTQLFTTEMARLYAEYGESPSD